MSPVFRLLCCLRNRVETWQLACVRSVSVRFRSKEEGTRVKDRAKNGGQNRESRPFLGLRNQTETLATQATWQPHSNAEFFVLFSPNAEPGARLIMYLKFPWLA